MLLAISLYINNEGPTSRRVVMMAVENQPLNDSGTEEARNRLTTDQAGF
jgi:hypothetical protein